MPLFHIMEIPEWQTTHQFPKTPLILLNLCIIQLSPRPNNLNALRQQVKNLLQKINSIGY